MRGWAAFGLAAALAITPSYADESRAIPEFNNSVKITTGLTYQAVLASLNPPAGSRRAVTIQNNNTNGDNCEIEITGTVNAGDTTSASKTIGGVSMTAAQVSILLSPGGSWQRYYPYLPSTQIVGTCANTGDTLYVSTQ